MKGLTSRPQTETHDDPTVPPRGAPAARRPAVAAGLLAATAATANAATTATFTPSTGVLSVFGDGADNSIKISRDAAGKILVNGGAISVVGGTPTVANTARIQTFGLGE